MVLQSPKENVAFEIFNAGGEINNYTKQGVVDIVLDQVPNGKVVYVENGSDPRNYRVDFSKVKDILGFEPKFSVYNGVKELLDSINNHVFDNVKENRELYGNIRINKYENR